MTPPRPRGASLDRERWMRAERAFFAALEETVPHEREALLDLRCGRRGELRDLVDGLLAAHRDAEKVLGDVARRSGLPRADSPEALPQEGRRFGAYRLVREIGRGGMGAVYLAERSDRVFEKRVAVKLLPPALGGAALRERFTRERQILARLDHPGIARLLDGGVGPDGTPFFVMEYVDGRPIHDHCDQLRLGLEARIRLFIDVCEAVEYAHRNLVIHRDLKPANILVTPDGRTKLLDFGIARLQDGGDPEEVTALTRWGGRPLTPAYASPEQIRGEPLTTASDVYSLGALLHRLLSGGVPYEVSGVSPAEAERVVCHDDPTPPSRASRQSGSDSRDPGSISRLRGTTPRGLRRRLEGDLDTIVLAALRKEPERRYGSPAALAEDLRRHLDGRPVTARPASLGYRARKLAGRRPGVVAAIAAALLAAGAYAATLHTHAVRLEAERNTAQLEAERRNQVTEFLLDLFEGADPAQGRGEVLSAADLLERGAGQLERLAGEPELHAELLMVMSRVYHALGSYDRSASFARQALDERWRVLGEEHPDVATSLARLGRATQARGDLDEAEDLHRAALALRTKTLGEGHPDVAASLSDLGTVLLRKGELAESERHFREALAWARGSEDHGISAASLNGLGMVMTRTGDFHEAERFHREALELERRVLGADHPSVAASLNNLALVLRRSGDLEGAEQLHREALELRIRVFGDDHPDVAASLNNLAGVLQARGDHPAAVRHLREALDIRLRRLDEDHPDIARLQGHLGGALRQLAQLHRGRGEPEEAERYLREALRHYGAAFDDVHPSVVQTRDELALLAAADRTR